MAHEKMKGLLAAATDEEPEAEEDDASVEAMRAYMAALKGDDAAAALEAFRTLQLAEG